MKRTGLIFLLIISINLFAQKHNPELHNAAPTFHSKIQALQRGELAHLSLQFMDSIKIKSLIHDKIDERDFDRHKSGFIKAEELKDISASSICEITDNYILLVVEDQFNQLRALTVQLNGVPIESTIIYADLLYISRDWYEYEARRYSPSRPYYFDPISHEFTFSMIFKIMKPQYEEVLIDLMDHEDETTNKRRIKINNEGFFNEPSYENIVCNMLKLNTISLKSSFFAENANKTIKDQTPGIKDTKYIVYLDRDQSLNFFNRIPADHDHIIRIMPEATGKLEVYQRIIYGFNINGDGDNCELQNPTYTSNWDKLEMKNDLISLKTYAKKERITPQISVKDLKQKIKTACGDYHLSLTNHINQLEDLKRLVQPRKITLKINFTDSKTKTTQTEYLVFVLANGC